MKRKSLEEEVDVFATKRDRCKDLGVIGYNWRDIIIDTRHFGAGLDTKLCLEIS